MRALYLQQQDDVRKSFFDDASGLNPIMPRDAKYMMIGIEFKRFPNV